MGNNNYRVKGVTKLRRAKGAGGVRGWEGCTYNTHVWNSQKQWKINKRRTNKEDSDQVINSLKSTSVFPQHSYLFFFGFLRCFISFLGSQVGQLGQGQGQGPGSLGEQQHTVVDPAVASYDPVTCRHGESICCQSTMREKQWDGHDWALFLSERDNEGIHQSLFHSN